MIILLTPGAFLVFWLLTLIFEVEGLGWLLLGIVLFVVAAIVWWPWPLALLLFVGLPWTWWESRRHKRQAQELVLKEKADEEARIKLLTEAEASRLARAEEERAHAYATMYEMPKGWGKFE